MSIFSKIFGNYNIYSFNLLIPRQYGGIFSYKKIYTISPFFGKTTLLLRSSGSFQNIRTLHFEFKRNNTHINKISVGYWLLGCSSLVFGMIILGGLTRLTESGLITLSITEWKPVTGIFPPLSHDAWIHEFENYKKTPEFKLLNQNISLSDYQFIYKMEWAHRIFGRIIGVFYLLPMTYFILSKKVTLSTAKRLLFMGGLLGLQGFIGWWMVKSGLEHEHFKEGSVPRVSQYRLVSHFGTALSLYACMLWTGLNIFKENKWVIKTNEAKNFILKELNNPILQKFKRMILALNCLIFITILSGAFVAGLDAGLIYNTFPYMGKSLIPPRSELFSEAYSRNVSKSDIWWRNMLENPVTVQLCHRILATCTFALTTTVFFYSRRVKFLKIATPELKNTISVLMATVCIQIILGISTLIYMVPVPLAALHQTNSLIVLTSIIITGNRLHIPRYFLKNYPYFINHFKPK
ncbi:hypothetical protein PCANB_001527 [Pneumocystis canis]|nr:hypothetical protein PCK1_001404 [Pneumocystis canis]KAG5439228.1 hypothetical protein PCANB_001527 [Pneumocystis canis]